MSVVTTNRQQQTQTSPNQNGKPKKEFNFMRFLFLTVLPIVVLFFGILNLPEILDFFGKGKENNIEMEFKPNIPPDDLSTVEEILRNGWQTITFEDYSALTRAASVGNHDAQEILKEMRENRHAYCKGNGGDKLIEKDPTLDKIPGFKLACRSHGIKTLDQIWSLGEKGWQDAVGAANQIIGILRVRELMQSRGYNVDFWKQYVDTRPGLITREMCSTSVYTRVCGLAPGGPKTVEWIANQSWNRLKIQRDIGKAVGDDLYKILRNDPKYGPEFAEKWIRQ